MPPVHIKIW